MRKSAIPAQGNAPGPLARVLDNYRSGRGSLLLGGFRGLFFMWYHPFDAGGRGGLHGALGEELLFIG
jgi:hypothetical protein